MPPDDEVLIGDEVVQASPAAGVGRGRDAGGAIAQLGTHRLLLAGTLIPKNSASPLHEPGGLVAEQDTDLRYPIGRGERRNSDSRLPRSVMMGDGTVKIHGTY
jgi:hypothetical protein